MTNRTINTSPARNLEARIALQTATTLTMRVASRSAADRRAVDPMIASRVRWTRAVLASALSERTVTK